MRALLVLVALTDLAHAGSAKRECEGGPKTAVVEYTAWIGSGAAFVQSDEPDRFVLALRAGAGFDFELAQTDNPFPDSGGDLEWRLGPWFAAEVRSDTSSSLHGGLSLDVGQVSHAEIGTYTLRFGGGVNDHRRAEATLMFLGGIRYTPGRRKVDSGGCRPRTAFASGGRVFGSITTDLDGRAIWMVGFEVEPSWALPPYSLRKLAGNF